jgi:hypothetical protein
MKSICVNVGDDVTIDGDEANVNIHDIVILVASISINSKKQLGEVNLKNYITNPHFKFFNHLD